MPLDPTPAADREALEQQYLALREQLSAEWLEFARSGALSFGSRADAMELARLRASMFESWIIGKLAEIQAVFTDQTKRLRILERKDVVQ